MFNIYDFFNSIDESKHLQSINYQFTPMEMSWIIYNCHKKDVTLKQKQEAFNEIISNTEDTEIKQRYNCAYRPSLHDFLGQYVKLQNRILQDFYCNENAIYLYTEYSCKYKEWLEEYAYGFPTFDAAFNDAKQDSQTNDISIVRVKKQSLLNPKNRIIIDFNIKQQELNIVEINYLSEQDYSLFYDSFDGMWFSFPVPFQKGDVVVLHSADGIDRSLSSDLCCGPFVLLGTTATTENKTVIEKGDNTDMTGYGYFQSENGEIYYECMFNYFDLEYYKGDFPGKKRVLKALSNCIKGEISEELFARAYHYVLMDEYAKSVKPTDITDEAMDLLGLK